jgi:hypothetical protein
MHWPIQPKAPKIGMLLYLLSFEACWREKPCNKGRTCSDVSYPHDQHLSAMGGASEEVLGGVPRGAWSVRPSHSLLLATLHVQLHLVIARTLAVMCG